ncbi:hypothetical protein [Albidovulum sediminis]|uniref:Uncharacterized protein n=1 Tax=Albidovulum sediminis TaxID=3066345 RepID=A0ABT2NH31_9RHOB|nr:hypothetical protein [Defluviimonas sediminis]MCT8328225.1 hypothetical protein [Defluviimonas sediminis]
METGLKRAQVPRGVRTYATFTVTVIGAPHWDEFGGSCRMRGDGLVDIHPVRAAVPWFHERLRRDAGSRAGLHVKIS